METILQQFYKDINLARPYMVSTNQVDNIINLNLAKYNYKEQQWKHTLTNNNYSDYELSQILFEFSHNVSICNQNTLELNPPEFDIIIPIDTTSFFEKVNALWFCYSTKLNIMILCFTSTYTNSLFLVDINYLHQDSKIVNNLCNGFKIHGGFLAFYLSFRDKMLEIINKYYNKNTKLYISGFSLGGAISTLAALDLYKYKINDYVIDNFTHNSFASPRIFNIIGANHFDSLNISSQRIYNDSDIVPSLPFPIMISSIKSLVIQDFMHIGKSISFNDNMGNYYDNHILSYLKYFKFF